jgi:hypothetical protein
MKMQDVKVIAQRWGVNCRIGRTKAAVIRDIQAREGYEPCFGTKETCDQTACRWRGDCLAPKRTGR